MSLPAKTSGKQPEIMSAVPVLDERRLRETVRLDHTALEIIAQGFSALSEGRVTMPPVLRLDIRDYNGEMDAKTAYISGFPYFALKVSCGFFENPKKGLPSLGGLMNLFHSETGQVAAILLDNGYLTDIRTALAGALAARYLAKDHIKTAGIIGTGMQARLQLEALQLVRDFDEALVWGRNFNKAEKYAEDMSAKCGIPVRAVENAEQLVRASDLVVTTTPATEPVIKADWLRPGIHVTAMGSDAPEKNELDPNIIVRADRYVCDRQSQCEILGELHHAVSAGVVPAEQIPVTELGDIIRGHSPGRENDEQVTVCDLTGTGVQDTAIACYAYERLLVKA